MTTLNPTFSWAPATGGQPASAAWVNYFNEAGKGVGFSPSDIQSCTLDRSNVWAPTFDDGPSENTRLVLDYFRGVGMKTTFWVIGLQVIKYPSALLQAYQEGHQIGIHTYSHMDLTTLSDAQIISELVYGARAIYDVIGKVPRFFRPPYGAIDDRVRAIAAKMGLFPVTWKEDSEDWQYVGTSDMYKVPASFRAWMDSGKSNEISLEHDLFYDTIAVVPENMDILIKSGKKLVTVSECIGAASSSYDNAILQRFFESGQFDNASALVPMSFARLSTSTNSTTTNSSNGLISSPALTLSHSSTHTMPSEGTSELKPQAMTTQTVNRTRTPFGTNVMADTQLSWNLPVPPVVFAIMIVAAVSVALTICIMVAILLAKRRKTKRDGIIVTDLTSGEPLTRDAVPKAAPISLLSDHQILQMEDEFTHKGPEERVSLIPGNAKTVRKEGNMSISWMDEFNSFNVSGVSMPKFREAEVKLVDLSTGYDVLRG
ncbi:chitin deacetylase [Chytriomyces hyalinus]|nr:chitin deacetylase [Chytriomyces hyalinus]